MSEKEKLRRQKPEVKERMLENARKLREKYPERQKRYYETYKKKNHEKSVVRQRKYANARYQIHKLHINELRRKLKLEKRLVNNLHIFKQTLAAINRTIVRKWRKLGNKNKVRASKRRDELRRYRNDIVYRLIRNSRWIMQNAIKVQKVKKTAHSKVLLGCSGSDFCSHMENLFWPGMSFRNRHKWQIDHIRPCADFNLADPEQQKLCFHYTNCQPLWADDNGIKSDRLDWTPHESRHSLPERLKPTPFIMEEF